MGTSFDKQWEKEEQRALTNRMHREYPAWRQRRHTRLICATTIAVAAGVTVFSLRFPTPTDYDSVACNRSGIADTHWVEVASNVLVKSHTL